MKKEMTILYQLHDNLYVNLTNRCPCNCTFCLRQTTDTVDIEGHTLWLSHEPSVQEVIDAFSQFDVSSYQEVVFCGFGEPTERIDALVEIAAYVKKKYHKPIRVNTNGLGSLIWKKDIAPMFQNVVDTVSISLNTPNAEKYHQLVRSTFGDISFQAMLDFAAEVKNYVPHVVLSTVATTITSEEEKECQAICDKLGVTYRIRPFE